jgi:hypothetical protein
MMCSASSAEAVGYSGTRIAPIEAIAKSTSVHSSRVRAISATRSPRSTPMATNPAASSATRRSASGHVTGSQPSPDCASSAGPSGAAEHASCHSPPIVPWPVDCSPVICCQFNLVAGSTASGGSLCAATSASSS